MTRGRAGRGAARVVTLLAAAAVLAPTSIPAQERPWTPLPSPQSPVCPQGLCGAERLAPFFSAMDGRRGGIVRIVQYGDSHTAARWIPEALAGRLRAQFPNIEAAIRPVGVVGATLQDFAVWPLDRDPPSPDLIILAFGVNEGFDDELDPDAYARLLREQLTRLRGAAPGAALLVLGAPDAQRGDGVDACPADPARRWGIPPRLADVRRLQRRAAEAAGAAFWDWQGRMGGACAAHRLSRPPADGSPALMRSDHVHFTEAGADWIGSLLFDDLQAAGRAWYAAQPRAERARR